MTLVQNWRDILARAWSVRFIVLAAILSGVEVAFGYLAPDWPEGVLAAASGFVSAAALLARVIAQSDLEE